MVCWISLSWVSEPRPISGLLKNFCAPLKQSLKSTAEVVVISPDATDNYCVSSKQSEINTSLKLRIFLLLPVKMISAKLSNVSKNWPNLPVKRTLANERGFDYVQCSTPKHVKGMLYFSFYPESDSLNLSAFIGQKTEAAAVAPKLSGTIHLKPISKMLNLNSKLLANPTPDGVDASLDLSDELGISEKSFLEAGFNFSDESLGGLPLSNFSKTASTAIVSAKTSSLNQLCAAYAHGISLLPYNLGTQNFDSNNFFHSDMVLFLNCFFRL